MSRAPDLREKNQIASWALKGRLSIVWSNSLAMTPLASSTCGGKLGLSCRFGKA
ncbi:MAG: hypothetical protein NTW32_02305 [Chloroflexi bacterium]|nr:hypothetical protein [Chloroflexota bacterium]